MEGGHSLGRSEEDAGGEVSEDTEGPDERLEDRVKDSHARGFSG